MFSFADDLFLPQDIELDAIELAENLRGAAAATQAVEAAIVAEDWIRRMRDADKMTEAQSNRLYLIFEAILELRLRDFGVVDSTPRHFP
jgi:hypothetical protein